MRQATTVASMYEKLCEGDRLELVCAIAGAEAADLDDSEAMMEAPDGMRKARQSSTLYDIAHEVLKYRPFVDTSTALVWNRECVRLKGDFSADSRGKLEKGWLLDEEYLFSQLLTYLKSQKRVTVQLAPKFVNETLLHPDTCDVSALDMINKNGLQVLASENAVYRWMQREGCKYEMATQTYYTDGFTTSRRLLITVTRFTSKTYGASACVCLYGYR